MTRRQFLPFALAPAVSPRLLRVITDTAVPWKPGASPLSKD
jgi:hypothetical protein